MLEQAGIRSLSKVQLPQKRLSNNRKIVS